MSLCIFIGQRKNNEKIYVISTISAEIFEGGTNLKNNINQLNIYEYLPKSKCGKCGVPTCWDFAEALADRKIIRPDMCPYLSVENQKKLLVKLTTPAENFKGDNAQMNYNQSSYSEKSLTDTVKQLEEIAGNSNTESVNIVNAGLMNAGKSSLFNALAKQEGLFAVDDIPTTIICKPADIGNSIILIDTPGLDAKESDTAEAHKAYREADLILFVHNVNTGELHHAELNAINKLKSYFPKANDFWDRFCLVCSRCDLKSDNEVQAITQKMHHDMKERLGGENYRLFITSAKRYLRGIAENKQPFITQSGIGDLKDYILSVAKPLKEKRNLLRQQRLDKARKELLDYMAALRSKREAVIAAAQSDYDRKTSQATNDFDKLKNKSYRKWEICKSLIKEYKKL